MAADGTLRVLLTADTVGGVWHYAVELAAGLARRSCAVTLAAMGREPTAAQRAQAASAVAADVRFRPLKLEWMDDAWDDVAAAGDWLLALADEARADVVHLNQFAFGALPFAAPKLVFAHSSVHGWWRAVRGRPAPADWDGYRSAVRRGLAGADAVAAPTEAMLASLRTDYGFAARGVVVSNGRDPRAFPPAAKEPLVYAAGRLWDEAKNLGALDRVAPRLGWPVVVAGATDAPHGGRAQAANVRLLGEVAPAEVAAWAGRASICAHPARYEPFGLSVLEAALAGCALVVGDIPSLREVWGPAALYADPGDDDAIAHALQRLVADPALRDRYAARARQRALVYGADAMVDATLNLYRALARRAANDGARLCVS